MSAPAQAATADSASAFLAAVQQGARAIEVRGALTGLPPVTLAPGQQISGADSGASLSFESDGVALNADSALRRLTITTPPARRALTLAPGVSEFGALQLTDLKCTGQVQLIFRKPTTGARLSLQRFTLLDADATGETERPHGNGVDVLQGAVTIWNQAEQDIVIPLEIDGLQIGDTRTFPGGTGLFIAGVEGARGGKIAIGEMRLGDVYADSKLPVGTTAVVSGGVFVLGGVTVESIMQTGSCVTRGANAVPIDNWGRMKLWRIAGDGVSYGPSAVGFVNAGDLDELDIEGVIETFGDGARGCGIYGRTGILKARAIRTHGPAEVGVQVLASLDELNLSEGVFTTGAPGEGLVKGVMLPMPAHAIHIEPGGRLGRIQAGRISATGADAQDICNEGQLDA